MTPRPFIVCLLAMACGPQGTASDEQGDADVAGVCPGDADLVERARAGLIDGGEAAESDLDAAASGVDPFDDLDGDGTADALVRPGLGYPDGSAMHVVFLSGGADASDDSGACADDDAGAIRAQTIAVATEVAACGVRDLVATTTSADGCTRTATAYHYDCTAGRYSARRALDEDLCDDDDDDGDEPAEDTCAGLAACAEGQRYLFADTQDVAAFCSHPDVCKAGGGTCHTGAESVIGICAGTGPSTWCNASHDSNGHTVYTSCTSNTP